ncbi:MAG TPA: carboxypeptidase regulatory-like domain-containing protein [Pyrinomonadaceae bacterium]
MKENTKRTGAVMRLIASAAFLLLIISPSFAQTDTARMQGVITDSNGAALPGATVTVTNLGTNRAVTTQANQDGEYTVPALPAGQYKVEVKQDAFKTTTQNVTLEVTQVARLDFKLEPGGVTEVIQITDTLPLVQTENATIGTVIQGRQVTELPLNGRNFTQLATLVPGVTRGVPDSDASGARGNAETFRNGSTGGAVLSVNGLRPQANNFILDGIDNNESLVNTIIIFPPAEAIQEFRVQTSVAPSEFGRAGGAVINTSIKSGTNQYHGSAFEFIRNDNLDARETFAPARQEFRRNQFGGTFGGPILKDKLFAFGDYQGLRQFLPLQVDRASVPTARMRLGDFSELLPTTIIRDPLTGLPFAGNIIPAGRINPVGQRYLNAFPLPNAPGVRQNYITQRTQIQQFNDFDVRVDWNVRTDDQFFGRFSYGQDNSVTSSRLPQLPAGFGSGTNFNRTRSLALGETHIFGQNVINELRLGYIRVFYGYTPPFQGQRISADLGIPNANTSPLLGGGALIGGFNDQIEYTGDFGPFLVPQNSYQVADTMSVVHGSHNLRFGASIIRRQVNLFRPNRGKGFFMIGPGTGRTTGYEVSELLVGFIDNYTIGPPFGTVGTRNWETGFYFQDDWRVNRKLVLNLGLRYDLYTNPTEVENRQANFDIATNRILIAGQDGNSQSLVPTDKNNFAPRLGFAYDWNGDGKTVIRGGYGIFYFLDRGGIDNQLAQNPPFSGFREFRFDDGYRITLSGRAPNGTLNSTLATGPLPTGELSNLNLNNPQNVTVFAALPTNKTSMVQQYNLQVQRELWRDTALSVAYVGTRGSHLTTYYNFNRQVYNAASGTRAFPNLGNVNVQDTSGKSSYNSLQAQLERRFSKGWQFLAAYTWAHAIDDSAGAFDNQTNRVDFRNLPLERGNSSLDVRHRFVFSTLYQLPFGRGQQYGSDISKPMDYLFGGWQLNSILILQTGLPFDLIDPGNPETRPDLIGTVTVTGNPDMYFNTSAFVRVPTNAAGVKLRPGTFGRNVLYGPGTKNLDLSLFKNFAITERVRTQFRAEVFNVTNTPQFSQPNGDITSGDFGKIRGTRLGTNRQIQFALRLEF